MLAMDLARIKSANWDIMKRRLAATSGFHMLTEIEYKKLAWHSRRGMLELDLLLLPFVERRLPALNGADQLLYQRLLSEEDQDLFAWLLLRHPAPDADLQRMVGLIRESAAA
jgi:antitoxin CptB